MMGHMINEKVGPLIHRAFYDVVYNAFLENTKDEKQSMRITNALWGSVEERFIQLYFEQQQAKDIQVVQEVMKEIGAEPVSLS